MKRSLILTIFFTLLSISLSAYSSEAANIYYPIERLSPDERNINIGITSLILDKDAQINNLERIVEDQSRKIEALSSKLEKSNDNEMDFSILAGILLAAVAVIVTTLGVALAIFSFFGYKKIMNSAQDAAATIATNKATEIAKAKTHEATKEVLIELIENDSFNDIIEESVEKFIYRGIQSYGQADLNGEDK